MFLERGYIAVKLYDNVMRILVVISFIVCINSLFNFNEDLKVYINIAAIIIIILLAVIGFILARVKNNND